MHTLKGIVLKKRKHTLMLLLNNLEILTENNIIILG